MMDSNLIDGNLIEYFIGRLEPCDDLHDYIQEVGNLCDYIQRKPTDYHLISCTTLRAAVDATRNPGWLLGYQVYGRIARIEAAAKRARRQKDDKHD